MLVVVPWRAGSTLWNKDIWQGRVTEGKTVWASMVEALSRIISCTWGMSPMASGRIPSKRTSRTFMVFLPFSYLIGKGLAGREAPSQEEPYYTIAQLPHPVNPENSRKITITFLISALNLYIIPAFCAEAAIADRAAKKKRKCPLPIHRNPLHMYPRIKRDTKKTARAVRGSGCFLIQ